MTAHAPTAPTAPTWLHMYLCSERISEAFVHVLRGTVDGLWLGVLGEDRLAVLDEHYYAGESTYVDEAHNRRGLFAWEEHVVAAHLPPAPASVAVTGAGGGREVLALVQRGLRATGYEPNPVLAAAGDALLAAEGRGGGVHACARSRWPGGEQRFDAVLLGWGSYMLVPSRRERIALLAGASRATGDRGPVALSYFEAPPGALAALQFRTARSVAAPLRRLRRAAPVVFGDALAPNFVHHFTRKQVAEELAAAGLELVDAGSGGHGYGWAVGRHRGHRGHRQGGRDDGQ